MRIVTNYGTPYGTPGEIAYTIEQFIHAVGVYFYPSELDMHQVVIKINDSDKVEEVRRAVAIVQELVPIGNFGGVITSKLNVKNVKKLAKETK